MPIKKSTIIKYMNFQYSKVYTHYFYWHLINTVCWNLFNLGYHKLLKNNVYFKEFQHTHNEENNNRNR